MSLEQAFRRIDDLPKVSGVVDAYRAAVIDYIKLRTTSDEFKTALCLLGFPAHEARETIARIERQRARIGKLCNG